MKIIPRKYQQKLRDDIIDKLTKVRKVAAVLPTGGGKSIVIGMLADILPGRTLILTHRQEILFQNAAKVDKVAILSSTENTLRYDTKVVVAMVQTLYARLEKHGEKYIGNFDNIILDEIQVLIFEKVFNKYNFKNLIGFTGTPVLNKSKYTTIDGVEYVEPYTLSELFDDMVIGPDTQDLIDMGFLCQDYNIALSLPDFDKLKESDSSPDGYTKKSLDEVYVNTASLDILSKAYTKHCIGKKTLIFNASTKINKFVYNHFKSKGRNVKLFDSVNNPGINPKTNKKYTRAEIIDWFNNERDAILINTNVFTTGFDVPDVEVIILNRATKSLSLFIQMVGRGSRTTDKIYKDQFTVIDLGQNIFNHEIWSARRNWKQWFHSPGKRPKNIMDMLNTWNCTFCGNINIVGIEKCDHCHMPKEDVVINGKKKKFKEGELEVIGDMPLPRALFILKYTKAQKEGSSFAFKLLERKIKQLFIHYRVRPEFYNKRKAEFRARVRSIYTPIYFAIIKSDLNGPRKKLDTQIERMFNIIDNLYD